MTDISPLAPEKFPDVDPVKGVRFATRGVGVKYEGRTDLMVAELAQGSAIAGVFTQSLTASAPVDACREALVSGKGRARCMIVNSGNANAFNGKKGIASVENIVKASADIFGCEEGEIFTASTGVIGEALPDAKITGALAEMKGMLGTASFEDAAKAIMTTDTYAKAGSKKVKIGDVEVTISGIAKGSGMIAPNMATMLSFVFTDAAIAPDVLQGLLKEATDKSFNAITVDSDTSTSDTVLLAATGKAGNGEITSVGDANLGEFKQAFEALMIDLAQQIVRDGEGATKFISIKVKGAETDGAAKRIALAIANSPLVKTAIAGEDANWGRIVMAVGKAGEKADRDKLQISIGGVLIAGEGEAVEGYDEAPVAAHMKGDEIDVLVDVGIASGEATVWTCDLTHGYITINADYRS
ncbi:Arginine biosynthesis bifunctional protein ArgJ (Includes: Glutamate N-acetyltransferase; Amino-acid acetyltransferase) [Candidatus Terasakiella magnetica]|uniref:Arginine biosynthesis bifunctional protein ArgJ n=1 Tax=Candidatus Terasakiella magnetica TaxID=1867952 RepID=A0A1C3RHL4_9PROT|nr:bifunctional glutamate N-acetyltransferase/amino-acid acetyltransferase ArgJ [Candidatus Terasakiella magnetica]SCA56765.1 Arginine biosynthesis bifunctional protein ArgJ (Includes: Glutamate N-acetyltransferase; Amino-acid acetyltransferase) [Candidatus Terasakiella magnetica]